jgi:hypothetical protein
MNQLCRFFHYHFKSVRHAAEDFFKPTVSVDSVHISYGVNSVTRLQAMQIISVRLQVVSTSGFSFYAEAIYCSLSNNPCIHLYC